MKLRIVHQTRYLYSKKVHFGPHRLVLRPREGHDLRVESMNVKIEPAAHLTWSRDVFGNSVATVEFEKPSKELLIESNALVVRMSPVVKRRKRLSSITPWPPVYDSLERVAVKPYQRLSYPKDAAAVKTWLENFRIKKPDFAEDVARNLNEYIYDELKYIRREEKGVLTPAQTLQTGGGSCRDLATLMLEAARSLGIAARFASGYLECHAAILGEASTHAWAEIYHPGRGWSGYDPSIGEETTSRHVVTGVSNHPRGVMPVSGSYYGKAGAFKDMEISVTVRPEPEATENDS
ncbi:transglutaminase family protein [Rariglobus hedericola]|nr:transglutaminase family protein [Rariglobus hedericola]